MNIKEINFEEFQIQYLKKNIDSLESKLHKLRNAFTENRSQIKFAEASKQKAELFEPAIKRDEEIKYVLATLRAKLESDKAFQAEIRNGLCPILSQKCLNLDEEETLDSYIINQFSDIKSKIEMLEIEQKDVAIIVASSIKARQDAASLPILLKRNFEIMEEGRLIREEQELLKKKFNTIEIVYPKTEVDTNGEVNCKVGSKLLKIAELLYSQKTYSEVFLQHVGDWREEYSLALREYRLFKAIIIYFRNTLDFAYNMLICSRVGNIFDFIIKLIGLIGIMFKLWK